MKMQQELEAAFWYRIDGSISQAVLKIYWPMKVANQSGFSSEFEWQFGGKAQCRKAFGATPWQAFTVALQMLYMEVESLEIDKNGTLYWSRDDASQGRKPIAAKDLFGGLHSR